ncbi:MAG: T9SS type A sorting domain-containing protein [Bacteroidota bacterium]
MNKLLHRIFLLPLLFFVLNAKSQEALVIRHPHIAVQQDSTFCVEIKADRFEDILGIQFALAWDEAILSYEGLKVGPSNSTRTYLPNLTESSFGIESEELRFVWTEPNLVSTTLPENSTLFQICFTANQARIGDLINLSAAIEAVAVQSPDLDNIPVIMANSVIAVGENDGNSQLASLILEDQSVEVGEEFCIPLLATGIDKLNSLQFSLEWDETQLDYTGLSFEGVNVIDLEAAPNFYTASENEFRLSWQQVDSSNLLLPDSVKLFSICFKAVGVPGTQTAIQFGESVPIEATRTVNDTLVKYLINARNSTINISRSNGNNTAQLSIADQSVESGDNFCLPITANDFEALVGIQFALDWDERLLAYDRVELGSNPLDLSDFNYRFDGEQLRFLWSKNDVKNIFIPDETPLFSICFDAIGNNTETIVTLGENLPLEAYKVLDNRIESIVVESNEGIVKIGIEQSLEAAKFTIENAVVQNGETFCVPLIAENIGEVISLQFSVEWEEALLKSTEVQINENLFSDILAQQSLADNRLSFSWIDLIDLSSIDLQDSVDVLSLCFEAQGTTGRSTAIRFGDSPSFEASITRNDGTDEIVEVQLKNGEVQFRENSSDVYAGDTDLDGEVSHYDLINIGLGYGETGPVRENASLAFAPQAAENWASSTPITNINYKHADTNGNGLIERDDLLAIEQNWTDAPTLFNTIIAENGTPFYVDIDTIRLLEEQQIPVVLGTEDQLAKKIYGLAFSIYYESEAMLSNGFGVSLHQSWLGEMDELIQVQRFFPEEKRMDISISRIDQVGRDGFGELLALDIVVEDVILFETGQINFRIDHVKAIGEVEQIITFNTKKDKLNKQNLTNTDTPSPLALRVYPNPASEKLYIRSEVAQIARIEIYDLYGKIVGFYLQAQELNICHLDQGLYFVHIHTNKGSISKKINIQ